MAASDKLGDFSGQIWFVSYPEGATRRISNDLNSYAGISVTADSATLATTRTNRISNLWLVPISGDRPSRQLTLGTGNEDRVFQVTAAPDRTIVFSTRQTGVAQLFRIGFDGGNRADLTSGADSHFNASVSRRGGSIAYVTAARDETTHVWVMDADGSNARQITNGENGEHGPSLSPDGRWLVHGSLGDRNLYRVSMEDGSSRILAEDVDGEAHISPDGQSIAYETFSGADDLPRRTAHIIPATGGAPTHRMIFDEPVGLRWAPSMKAITGLRQVEARWNIWEYPLDGSPPRQITDFEGDRVFEYAWSVDGRDLIVVRGRVTRDIVLISDFR